jgi:hypothetical protein
MKKNFIGLMLLTLLAYPFEGLASNFEWNEPSYSGSVTLPIHLTFDLSLFGSSASPNFSSEDEGEDMDVSSGYSSEEETTYVPYSQPMNIISSLESYKGNTLVFRNDPIDIKNLTDAQFECFCTAYEVQFFEGPYCRKGCFQPAIQANECDPNLCTYFESFGKNKFSRIFEESLLSILLNHEQLHHTVLHHLLQPNGIYVLSIHNPADMANDLVHFPDLWPSYVTGTNFKTPEEIKSYYSQTAKYFSGLGFSKIELGFSRREFNEDQGMPVEEIYNTLTAEERKTLQDLNDEDYHEAWKQIVHAEQERDERLRGIRHAPVYMILTK